MKKVELLASLSERDLVDRTGVLCSNRGCSASFSIPPFITTVSWNFNIVKVAVGEPWRSCSHWWMNATLLHFWLFNHLGCFLLKQTHTFEVFKEKSTNIKNECVLEESGGWGGVWMVRCGCGVSKVNAEEMPIDAFIHTDCWCLRVCLGGAGCQTQGREYPGCFGEDQGGPS